MTNKEVTQRIAELCRDYSYVKDVLSDISMDSAAGSKVRIKAKNALEKLRPDFNQKPVITRKRTYTRRAAQIRGFK